ncbi:MAG: DJ-1 family glyoxalase III [Candidatus Omnitrophota bacterium]
MKKKTIIVLAEGFEEVETVTPIDILRRAGIDVAVAGLDGHIIVGSRGVVIKADITLEEMESYPDAVIFPGGMPGAENLARSVKVKDLILGMHSEERLIAAICASPALVLAPTGVLDGKTATCYPGMEENFSPEITFSEDTVIQDGNIITSRGVGTALDFSLKIVENLVGKDTAELVGEQTLHHLK